jgi:tetratricopeptide (TPR) repeat protein
MRPRHAEYAVQFARALARTHRTGEALQVANVALTLSPSDPLLLDALGTVYTQCHAHERAASVFRRAAALAPANAICHFNFTTSLIFSGNVEQAESELEPCLTLAPDHWPAYDALSRLRRQSPVSNHIERLLLPAQQTGGDPAAQMQLHMALAKEYEDLGDYPEAFEHLRKGKSVNRDVGNHTTDRDEAIVHSLVRAFPEPRPQPPGCLSDDPIHRRHAAFGHDAAVLPAIQRCMPPANCRISGLCWALVRRPVSSDAGCGRDRTGA